MTQPTDRTTLARRLRALGKRLEQAAPDELAEAERLVAKLEEEVGLAEPNAARTDLHGASAGAVSPSDLAPSSGTGPIHVWSDGSCAPNPGKGGWGAIIERDGKREELSGNALRSTNNIMEMTAAIEALRRIPSGARVTLTTDSQYLRNGITKWIHAWKRRGWRKADGEPVLNQPLWMELDGLVAERRVEWKWIRGHSGHAENERCDELANEARHALDG